MTQIEPLLCDAPNDSHALRSVSCQNCSRQIVKDLAIGHSEHTSNVLARELRSAERDYLIEQAHRVAHGTGCLPRQDLYGRVVSFDVFFFENLYEASGDP